MDLELKNVLSEIQTGVGAFGPRFDALQRQVDAIDKARNDVPALPFEQKSLVGFLKENDSVGRLLTDGRGKAVVKFSGTDCRLLERKTTITSPAVGSATTGVLPIQRLPDITPEARQQLTIRDLLTATPTTFQVIDFVKVLSPLGIASMVPEASTKPENAMTFTSQSERVKTVASWIPASRQIMDDMNGLASFLSNSLVYYTDLAEEMQILSGDNTGENLHGLLPQATAFNTSVLSNVHGWNKIDLIGRAIEQVVNGKELPPTFLVMHPSDWWDIRLTKDNYGRYILGDPQEGPMAGTGFGSIRPNQNIFGLSVDPTTNIAQGTFLVGSGSPVAVEIMDRLETVVEISTEHASFFTQNLVAVRAEKRLALVTRRPGSFVTGTFTTSP